MNNSIAQRISDFLKDHKPFSFFKYDELVTIAKSIEVLTIEKNKFLFQANDPLHNYFYVVNSGSFQTLVYLDASEILINKSTVGDIIGLRPFFAKNNYQVTVKAKADSIIYAIPIEDFRPFLGLNPEILNYLLESFAANSNNSSLSKTEINHDSQTLNFDTSQHDFQYFQQLNYNTAPLKIDGTTTIKEAAQLLTNNLLDNAIVVQNNLPIGIVTDADFRSKVTTGKVPTTHTVEKIMASPVVTIHENISVAEAQIIMLKNQVSHLCVTADGTNKSKVKGIITQNDLVQAQANNLGVLIKEVKKSSTAKELKVVRDKLTDVIQSSLTKDIPLQFIQSIVGEITIAIVHRAVELAILDLGSPPTSFAYFCVGSQARKEQLLLTDQDSILIFNDVTPELYRDVKDYFIKLAKKTTSTLEKVGYYPCVHGHVASNILYCNSLTDWIKQYNNWINTPGENTNEISTAFFDIQIAFGDIEIENNIIATIYKSTNNNTLFFDYLGNNALKKPAPLNFFKKFTNEEEGENKGKFNLKIKALAPLIDAARLLVLSFNIKGFATTYLRYKQLALVDVKNADVYLNCAEAFITISKIKTEQGLRDDSTGEFIAIESLSKADKEKLKHAVSAMDDMEDLIKNRFQLTQFS